MRLEAFHALFQNARDLVLGNATLIVLDYLIRCEDRQLDSVRGDLEAAHSMIERFLGDRSSGSSIDGSSFPPLSEGFDMLARLVSSEGFPSVQGHGDISLPDIFRDADVLDLTALPIGEKQACRRLSRSRSLAEVPMSLLAAAHTGLSRLLGVDHVLARAEHLRTSDELQADLELARATLERIVGIDRVLDMHMDALHAIANNQARVCRWMINGLQALTRRDMDAEEVIASVDILSAQRAALHHYAVIFELRYQYMQGFEDGKRPDKYRLMHQIRDRTPIGIGIKRIASYFCVAMRYSSCMRSSTRLVTLAD